MTHTRLALLSLALAAPLAWAQSTKPGLWEIQHKMGGSPEMDKAMAEMQKQLAAMPPQRVHWVWCCRRAASLSSPSCKCGGTVGWGAKG